MCAFELLKLKASAFIILKLTSIQRIVHLTGTALKKNLDSTIEAKTKRLLKTRDCKKKEYSMKQSN